MDNLIKKQGLILEHQTYNVFSDCLSSDKVERQSISYSLRFDKGGITDYIEIDVYCAVRQRCQDFTYNWKEPGKRRANPYERVENNALIRAYFLVQCKGHPQRERSGFLLCRQDEHLRGYYEEFLNRHNKENANIDLYINRENAILVNWASFYKLAERKDEYQEDKTKFYNAVQQLNDSIYALYQNENIISFREKDNKQKEPHASFDVIRIIPLIVTNSPIYVINIDAAKRNYHIIEAPFVTYINNYDVFDDCLYRDSIREFRYYNVITLDYLREFIKIVMLPSGSFKSLFKKYCKPVFDEFAF